MIATETANKFVRRKVWKCMRMGTTRTWLWYECIFSPSLCETDISHFTFSWSFPFPIQGSNEFFRQVLWLMYEYISMEWTWGWNRGHVDLSRLRVVYPYPAKNSFPLGIETLPARRVTTTTFKFHSFHLKSVWFYSNWVWNRKRTENENGFYVHMEKWVWNSRT